TSRRAAACGVRSRPSPAGSTGWRLIVGGTQPSRILRIVTIASIAPAAPRLCPIIDLLAVIDSSSAWSPKIVRIACSSALSPSGVDVAWALTWATSAGWRPALARARRAAPTAPIPPGAGSVMCEASAVAPYPMTSARIPTPRAGADVRDPHRDEERADAVGSAGRVRRDPLDEGPDAAEPGAEDHPGPLGLVTLEPRGQAGLIHRLAGRHEPELDVAVRPAHVLLVEDARRVEVLDLTGDPRLEPGRVERGDRC